MRRPTALPICRHRLCGGGTPAAAAARRCPPSTRRQTIKRAPPGRLICQSSGIFQGRFLWECPAEHSALFCVSRAEKASESALRDRNKRTSAPQERAEVLTRLPPKNLGFSARQDSADFCRGDLKQRSRQQALETSRNGAGRAAADARGKSKDGGTLSRHLLPSKSRCRIRSANPTEPAGPARKPHPWEP